MKSTVLQGSDVQFNATVGGSWQVMTWNVGGFLVLTVSKSSGIIPSTEQFSARFCSQNNSCVEFTIHNVTRSQSGPVICTVQGDYGEKTAQLYVQGGFINIYLTFWRLVIRILRDNVNLSIVWPLTSMWSQSAHMRSFTKLHDCSEIFNLTLSTVTLKPLHAVVRLL